MSWGSKNSVIPKQCWTPWTWRHIPQLDDTSSNLMTPFIEGFPFLKTPKTSVFCIHFHSSSKQITKIFATSTSKSSTHLFGVDSKDQQWTTKCCSQIFCHKRNETTTSREGHKSNKLPFLGSLLRSCSLKFLKMNPIELVFGLWKKRVDCAISTCELTEANVLQMINDAFDSLGWGWDAWSSEPCLHKGLQKGLWWWGYLSLVCVHCSSHFLLSHKPFQANKSFPSLSLCYPFTTTFGKNILMRQKFTLFCRAHSW